MREYPIQFLQPERLNDVPALLPTLTDRSLILAGGTDLLIKIRKDRPDIDAILSICRLKELQTVEAAGSYLKIGAMVTHTQASEDEAISSRFCALSMACGEVGSKQIRNKGTIGGSIMNASVASDITPCICLFQGELEFLTVDGLRRVSIFEYLENHRQWESPQILLTAIYLPMAQAQDSCFIKLGSREEVTIAQISLSVSWATRAGEERQMRAVLGAVSPVPKIDDPMPLLEGASISEANALAFSKMLREEITNIRLVRKRPSKLKITPAEQQYKERAVKGLVFDIVDCINHR